METAGSILSPFFFFFLMIFFQQTSIPLYYRVGEKELGYYTLFIFYMIPWSTAIDVFILNSQELVHGWRSYDYIAYQKYRFHSREKRWVLHTSLVDESISESHQSIDLMNFSSQYYFLISLISCGMIINVISLTILLRTVGYNFIGDPALLIIVLSMVGGKSVSGNDYMLLH